jgi:hypothetical protein
MGRDTGNSDRWARVAAIEHGSAAFRIVVPTAPEPLGAEVVAVFRGHLDAAQGLASAIEFAASLQERGKAVAVFDVRDMSGYDREARLAWQHEVGRERHRIAKIVMVGGSRMVRMGGSVLAMALGVPIEFREA